MRSSRPFCAVLLSLCLLFSSCSRRESSQLWTWNLLGTVCSVNALGDGDERLRTAIGGRLEEIDSLFSVNRPESDVSRVNAAAGKARVVVSPEVFFVLEAALDFARKSGGSFDPTVGPLVTLWGIGTDHEKVPSQAELDAALALVDWRKVSLDAADRSVFLEDEGMALDLGGIAKGYAADELARILRERKSRRAIVDLGGNVYLFGSKKDGSAWNVGIKNPADGGSTVAAVLPLAGGRSVVTSGAYERFFISGGRRYHHIIDPKTGFPSEGEVASATIVSPSSMEADAMSTSAFIMGMEAFVRAFPSVSCVFIFADGGIYASEDLSLS